MQSTSGLFCLDDLVPKSVLGLRLMAFVDSRMHWSMLSRCSCFAVLQRPPSIWPADEQCSVILLQVHSLLRVEPCNLTHSCPRATDVAEAVYSETISSEHQSLVTAHFRHTCSMPVWGLGFRVYGPLHWGFELRGLRQKPKALMPFGFTGLRKLHRVTSGSSSHSARPSPPRPRFVCSSASGFGHQPLNPKP